MRYILVVHPDQSITLEPYETWETIQTCVEGPFQILGQLPPDEDSNGYPYTVYCNEEYYFQEGLEFNPVASGFATQPVYGNIAILVDGKTEDGDYDSFPMDERVANRIKALFEQEIHTAARQRVYAALNSAYKGIKPEPPTPIVKAMTAEEFKKMLGIEE